MSETAKRAPRKPQDHKEAAASMFTFTAAGKEYQLPFLDGDIFTRVPAGIASDALVDETDQAQLRLGLALVKSIEGHEAAVAAFRALSLADALPIVQDWLQASEAPLGE